MEQDKTVNNITEGGCFAVQFVIALSPTITPLRIVTVLCADALQELLFLSWMAIPLTAFEYSKGSPKKLISSNQGSRYFCQDCETPLTCLLDEYPKYIYVTICSLDNPQDFEPSGDLYVEEMLNWIKP